MGVVHGRAEGLPSRNHVIVAGEISTAQSTQSTAPLWEHPATPGTFPMTLPISRDSVLFSSTVDEFIMGFSLCLRSPVGWSKHPATFWWRPALPIHTYAPHLLNTLVIARGYCHKV
jgi:hypothetical protein